MHITTEKLNPEKLLKRVFEEYRVMGFALNDCISEREDDDLERLLPLLLTGDPDTWLLFNDALYPANSTYHPKVVGDYRRVNDLIYNQITKRNPQIDQKAEIDLSPFEVAKLIHDTIYIAKSVDEAVWLLKKLQHTSPQLLLVKELISTLLEIKKNIEERGKPYYLAIHMFFLKNELSTKSALFELLETLLDRLSNPVKTLTQQTVVPREQFISVEFDSQSDIPEKEFPVSVTPQKNLWTMTLSGLERLGKMYPHDKQFFPGKWRGSW